MDSDSLDHEARLVLVQYVPEAATAAMIPLENAGGWSGSNLWRLTVREPEPPGKPLQFCLRRWPAQHPSPERLRQIHGVLAHVAAAGLTVVPAAFRTRTGETFVASGGRLWELSPWMPGAAESLVPAPRSRLAAALRTLATFHRLSASAPWAAAPPAPGPAPTVVERRDWTRALVQGGHARLVAAIAQAPLPELGDTPDRLLRLTHPQLPTLLGRLEAAATARWPQQPAIRDVHRDHVLFTGDEVTGLVDFGALRLDTPLADVARLIGSLAADDRAARQAGLDAYGEVCPLSPLDLQRIELLDAANALLGGLLWLHWLFIEYRDLGPLRLVMQRLQEFADRLARGTAERGALRQMSTSKTLFTPMKSSIQ